MRLATYDMTLTLHLLHALSHIIMITILLGIAVTTFQHSTRLMNYSTVFGVYTYCVHVRASPVSATADLIYMYMYI